MTMRVNGPAESVQAWAVDLRGLPGVGGVTASEGVVAVVAAHGPALIAPAVQAAQARGVAVTGVDVSEPDLEAVFLHLTGKALRD